MRFCPPYFVGLPQWNHSDWESGPLSGHSTHRALTRYARFFNSVEGNTTFYGIPDSISVNRWETEVPDHFKFCFKMPQTITHRRGLHDTRHLVVEFLDQLHPIHEKIGLICIQLPATFSPKQLPILEAFLKELPQDWNYSVEVRHLDFFNKQAEEKEFNQLLAQLEINRTLFDTRWLFAEPQDDEITQEALQNKPRVPLHVLATGQQPMVRFISPLQWQHTDKWLEPWINKVIQWIDEGKTPYLFFHTPDNREAPLLARHFCQLLENTRPSLTNPLSWPDAMHDQSSLFD